MARFVERFQSDFVMTRDGAINVTNAQATFVLGDDLTLVLHDFRVNEDSEGSVLFVLEVTTNDNDSFEPIDLDRSKRDSDLMRTAIFPIQGGAAHIFDQLFGLVGYDVDPD